MEQAQHEGAHSLSAGNASSSCTMLTADAPANDGAYLSMDGAVIGAHASLCRQLGAIVADTFASVQAPPCDTQTHFETTNLHTAHWQLCCPPGQPHCSKVHC